MISNRHRLFRIALGVVVAVGAIGVLKLLSGHSSASREFVRLTDITRAAGVDFRQSHGGCGKSYFVEQTGAGVAMVDVDGDGSLDLYFPQPTWLPGCKGKAPLQAHLFHNDGKGHFTPVPGAGGATCSDYGIGAAVGDYNNDGRPDLFVSCYGKSHLFRNDGGCHFTDVTDAAHLKRQGYSTSAAWLDYNRDGYLDLFVCGYVEWNPSMKIYCPSPSGKPDYCTPELLTPAPCALYRNNGDGTFTDVTREAGLEGAAGRALGVLAADLDGDGWTDLFVANDESPNMFFRNLGNGHFSQEAMERGLAFGQNGKAQANMGIACGDYSHSGAADVLVTTFANQPFTLYKNDGHGNFTDVSAETGLAAATYVPLGFGAEFLDLDNDGWPDLFFANGHVEQHIQERSRNYTYAQRNQVFLNNQKGGFVEAPGALPLDDIRVHRGLAVGDLDGDGRLDLVVTSVNDRPVILHNDTQSENSQGGHWLTVDLRNKWGSSSVIGARVRIEAGGMKQTARVVGGGSYLSQSDYARHFGLGASNEVQTVEITWPDGSVQAFHNVHANQRLVVKQQRA